MHPFVGEDPIISVLDKDRMLHRYVFVMRTPYAMKDFCGKTLSYLKINKSSEADDFENAINKIREYYEEDDSDYWQMIVNHYREIEERENQLPFVEVRSLKNGNIKKFLNAREMAKDSGYPDALTYLYATGRIYGPHEEVPFLESIMMMEADKLRQQIAYNKNSNPTPTGLGS